MAAGASSIDQVSLRARIDEATRAPDSSFLRHVKSCRRRPNNRPVLSSELIARRFGHADKRHLHAIEAAAVHGGYYRYIGTEGFEMAKSSAPAGLLIANVALEAAACCSAALIVDIRRLLTRGGTWPWPRRCWLEGS